MFSTCDYHIYNPYNILCTYVLNKCGYATIHVREGGSGWLAVGCMVIANWSCFEHHAGAQAGGLGSINSRWLPHICLSLSANLLPFAYR